MALAIWSLLTLVIFPISCISTSDGVPQVDVAIVGGGLSGLSTAYAIHDDFASENMSTLLFEARDRFGGRVLNRHFENGGVQEVGAEFVGPTQDHVLALIQTLQLETYEEYDVGSNIFYNGSVVPYDSIGLPPLEGPQALQLFTMIQTLNELAASIDVGRPWTHPNAEEFDSQTWATWLDGQSSGDPDIKALFEVLTTSVFSTETSELSFLFLLSYIAAAGNSTLPGSVERLISTTGGAQELKVKGGTQLIATGLASKVKDLGGDMASFQLDTPISKISNSGLSETHPYTLYSDGSKPVAFAKSVVVAMSPPLASRIFYDPPLPASRDQLTQRMPMGAIGKAILAYESPFWREQNLTGQILSVDPTTTIHSTFDNSPPDASYGAIMGFIEANVMRRLDTLSEEEVRELVIDDFVKYLGEEAGNPTDFLLQRWDLEVYSRGGPTAYAPPAVITQYQDALTKPCDKIFWAGTETSDFWQGYMDGAVRSGQRAAQEVVAALRGN